MKKITSMLIVLLMLLLTVSVGAAEPYENYVYDSDANPQQEPQAYIPERVIAGADFDALGLNNPKDLFVTEDDKLYTADTGNNRIVRLNAADELVAIYGKPAASLYSDKYAYEPKLVVDTAERM